MTVQKCPHNYEAVDCILYILFYVRLSYCNYSIIMRGCMRVHNAMVYTIMQSVL